MTKQLIKILFAPIALVLVLCASNFTVHPVSANELDDDTAQEVIFRPNYGDEEEEEEIEAELEEEPQFIARDIALSPELQEYTWQLSEEYGVPFELVLAIMQQESNFDIHVRDNINGNGTRDRGPMQINSVNWNWLQAQGLDVNDAKDNIEAGVLILSMHMDKYPLEQALVAYQCGEGTMKSKGLTSTPYSRDMLRRSELYALPEEASQPEDEGDEEAAGEEEELAETQTEESLDLQQEHTTAEKL